MIATRESGAFAALGHGDFRGYWIASTTSMLADNNEHVLSYWMIFTAFNSPALAGFAVISHWLPWLLFAIPFGALADRHDCRRLIQLGQVMLIGISLSWAALSLTGTLEMWHAVILFTLHGFAGAIQGSPQQLLLHDIVGPDDLQSAVRLSATSRNLAILFGPALGGAMLVLLGPAWGLVANVLFYVPFTAWLQRTVHTGHRRLAASAAAAALSLAEAVRTFRDVASNRSIATMVLVVGVTSLLVGNAFQPQMPTFAVGFGMGTAEVAYSALLGANGAGAVAGAVLLESSRFLRRPRARTALVMGALWGASIVVFALTASYVVGLLALFVAGMLSLAYSSMAQTLVQLEAPPDRRGRVVGLFGMSSLGLRVGSGATVGLLGSVIGVHASLAWSAVAVVAVCVALLAAFRPAPSLARTA